MPSKPTLAKVALGMVLLPFICLPLVSIVAWHRSDTRIPNDDAGQYTQTAADMYRPLAEGHPLKFVKNLYFKRGFRPVSLPCFAALCLPLTGGDLKMATALTLCCFYLLLYVYSFLILRMSTTLSAAALGAAIVTTLPWILQYSSVFFADVPMVAAMAAALYHAQRCENWTSLAHSAAFGGALALAISLRPIEPWPAVATLLTFLLIAAYKAKRIGLADLRLTLIPLVPLMVLTLLGIFAVVRSKSLAAGLFCPAIALYVWAWTRSRVPLNRCFAATALTFLGGIGLWFLPAVRQTWLWAWSCSFGDLNRLYKGVGQLDFRSAVTTIGTALGGVQLAFLAALAGVALIASVWSHRRAIRSRGTSSQAGAADAAPQTDSRPAIPGAWVLSAGLLQVVLVILLAAVTPGTDLRRGYVGFYWVFLGLTIYATSPLLKGYRLRTLALGGFAAAQLTIVSFSAIGPVPAALGPVVEVVQAAYPAPQRAEDKSVRTFREALKRLPPKCDVAAMTVAINVYDQRVFDLSALGALSSINRSAVRFGCPCIFETLAEGYRDLERYSFVLLDTRATFPTIPPHKRKEPYSRLSEDLATRYQQNRLTDLGLEEWAKFNIDDVDVVVLKWTTAPATASRPASSAR
jgi:hypothetical protein